MKYDKKTLLGLLNKNSIEIADGKREKYKESDITDAMVNLFKKEMDQLKKKHPDTDFEVDDYEGEPTDAFLKVLQAVGQIGGLNPLNEASGETPKKKIAYTKTKLLKLFNDNSMEVLNGDREKYKSSDITKEMVDKFNDGLVDLQDEFPEVDFSTDDYEGDATDKFLRLLDSVGNDVGFNVLDDKHEQRMAIKEMTKKFARTDYTPSADISEMARYLEYLDYVVTDDSRNKFDVIMDSYLNKHDPTGSMSIYAAANKMNEEELSAAIGELKDIALFGENHQLHSFMQIRSELSKHLGDNQSSFDDEWESTIVPLISNDQYLEAVSKIDDMTSKYNISHINIGHLVPNELSLEIRKDREGGILYTDGRKGKTDAELNGDAGNPEGQVAANESYDLGAISHINNASEILRHPNISEIDNWSILVDHNSFKNGSDLYKYLVKNSDYYDINPDNIMVLDNDVNSSHYGLVIVTGCDAVGELSGIMGLLTDNSIAFEYKAFSTLITEGTNILIECSEMPEAGSIVAYCKDVGGNYNTVSFNESGTPIISVNGVDVNRLAVSENYSWIYEIRENIDGVRLANLRDLRESFMVFMSRKFTKIYENTDVDNLVINDGKVVNDINASRLAGKLRLDTNQLLKILNNGNIVQ